MDELKKAWESLQKERRKTDFQEQEIETIIHQKSKGILFTLRRKVLIKFYKTVTVFIIFGIMTVVAQPLLSQYLLLVLTTAFLIGSILLYQEKRELDKEVTLDQPPLHAMENVRDRILEIIHLEELVKLTLYPISLAAGFLIGLNIGAKDGTMDQTKDWITLVLMMAILIPAAHWFTKKMNKRNFGAYLEKLNENIEALKSN